MYGFFNTIPVSIDEAAKIDGAGHARIFFTIILRLVAPILAVVGLLSFIGTLNEFAIASVMLDRRREADPRGRPRTARVAGSDARRTGALFSAGAVLAAIPVMVLFLFLQKYIVGGLTSGA